MQLIKWGLSEELRQNRGLVGMYLSGAIYKNIILLKTISKVISKYTFWCNCLQFSNIEECLSDVLRYCPSITEEDCDYHGKYINTWKAKDEKECQSICGMISYPDCGYFSFIKSEKNCDLYELPNKNCISIGGSKGPSLLQCLGMYGNNRTSYKL